MGGQLLTSLHPKTGKWVDVHIDVVTYQTSSPPPSLISYTYPYDHTLIPSNMAADCFYSGPYHSNISLVFRILFVLVISVWEHLCNNKQLGVLCDIFWLFYVITHGF